MIAFEEHKAKLNDLKPKLDALADSLGLDRARDELERLHAQAASEGFWDDLENSQKVLQKTKQLESKVEAYEKMQSEWEDLYTICEMALEENDESMLDELLTGFEALEQMMEQMRLQTTPWCPSTRAPAEPRRRTGARCSTGCTPAGPSATALPTRS